MPSIYLDNASTTFPKPQAVPDAMYRFMTQVGSNINRGGYARAYDTEETVYETRQLLCGLFGGQDCRQVIFTKNVTESLNLLLKGFLRSGDHVLVSSMEHNAVMRPLVQLEARGVAFTRRPLRRGREPVCGAPCRMPDRPDPCRGHDPCQQRVRHAAAH